MTNMITKNLLEINSPQDWPKFFSKIFHGPFAPTFEWYRRP